MLECEPFLRAIFATPDDDLPRLVFADWLDEHGDHERAELIRVSCEAARFPQPGQAERIRELIATGMPAIEYATGWNFTRGFFECDRIVTNAGELSDPTAFRHKAVSQAPEWYGATRLSVTAGRISAPEPLETIFTSPVTERVVELDLGGREEGERRMEDGIWITDYEIVPTITVRMVERLAQTREVRRLTALDLTNNNLDNDALNALAKSTHFLRLKRLRLSTGNVFRGRTWQKVQERFGPDVVE